MMNEVKIGVYVKGNETFSFEFYTELSAAKKLEFVNLVTSLVVDGDSYNSIIKDLVFNFYLVDIFTDISTVNFKTSEHFLDDVEEFFEDNNIIDILVSNVKDGLIEELNKAVDLDIQYKTGIHPSPLNEALSNLVNTFERKIKEIDLTGMMEMASKFVGMTDDFTTENIVKAYMNTDVAKNNIIEIDRSKKEKNDIAENLDEAIKTTDGSKLKKDEKSKKTTKSTSKVTKISDK